MHKRYVIGIDPGVKTGLACYDREKKQITQFGTTGFWHVYESFAQDTVTSITTLFIIETPKKTRLYDRQDGEQGDRRREKIASNIGSNGREAELLAEGIERLGFEVKRVVPTSGKWTAADLKLITGITERTSQHVRDAIALCYGL